MQTPRDPTSFPVILNHVAFKILHAYTDVLRDADNIALYRLVDKEKEPVPSETVDGVTRAWGRAMPGLGTLRERER